MDQPPQPIIPFGLFYNILSCFDRRELCQLRNVNRRHYTVIENKFGTTRPYLMFNEQLLTEYRWKWWPASRQSDDEMPSDVRNQLPVSKFVRFKSSKLLVDNLIESNLDVLSMSHVWENQDLSLNCHSDFAWNEEWAYMAAKAKHLDVFNGQGSFSCMRQLTSGNCVRLSIRDWTDTFYTVELPWDHILDFLFQPNPIYAKTILLCAKNPFNHHQVEMLHFLLQVKQKFLDSVVSVHFTFAWESFPISNTFTLDGPGFDDFILQNRRTQQRLRFHSSVQQFRLDVEEQD
ncbi:hypothetical protein Ddc_04474 [Ditylenchus destructor]|nr:hypothetical protein Ddc_04474 [Ditylenchus destructor]